MSFQTHNLLFLVENEEIHFPYMKISSQLSKKDFQILFIKI